ncbi:hypothetical protein LTR60_004121, partial [Cryomyces antarcticus]
MAERNGVINLHLAVDTTDGEAMTMLYKIAEGAVTEEHYGLALAKVVPLPAQVLEHATLVATKLEQQVKRKKKTSLAIIHSRRRKLILNLKEHLVQAQNGSMEGDVLRSWLNELQKEFVIRMTAIDTEAREAESESVDVTDEESTADDVEAREQLRAREGTVISISDDVAGESASDRTTTQDSHMEHSTVQDSVEDAAIATTPHARANMSPTASTTSEESFEFVETPPAPSPAPQANKYGVRTTSYPAIKNAPLPADASGSKHFNNKLLFSLLALIPLYLSWKIGGGLKTWIFFAILTAIPILMTFWTVASSMSPRKNEKASYPGAPVEHYLTFHKASDRARYHGKSKIPMETFHEMYFAGDVDFNGDALEVIEYRHDWANFRFTLSLFWFFLTGMIPEVIMHTRSQDEEQVRDHYDRGDDFYGWFLGSRMIYTSGIISDINKEETLEQLQDNKLAIVCEKIGLKSGERLLDIGCGWGTLAKFASVNYGASAT